MLLKIPEENKSETRLKKIITMKSLILAQDER